MLAGRVPALPPGLLRIVQVGQAIALECKVGGKMTDYPSYNGCYDALVPEWTWHTCSKCGGDIARNNKSGICCHCREETKMNTVCPVCGKKVQVTSYGFIYRHRRPQEEIDRIVACQGWAVGSCAGSHRFATDWSYRHGGDETYQDTLSSAEREMLATGRIFRSSDAGG